MPLYEYEAKSIAGVITKGKMEANDETAVASALRSRDYYPLRIKHYNPSVLSVDLSKYKKLSIKTISIFCRQFSVIINAGISIMRGLEIVKHQTEDKKLRTILDEVLEDVQKGKSLSFSMGKHEDFPPMLVNMIEVGEASGTLDKIMDRMANYYDKEYKLKQKIKQALTYPVVICIVAVVVVIFLTVKVVPTFVGLIETNGSDAALPLPTRIVIGFSSFIRFKWYILVIAIVAITIIIRYILSTKEGRYKFDRFKLKMPLFGKVNNKIATSSFTRTFGILISSGVPLMQSIAISSDIVGNKYIKSALDGAGEQIKKGHSIGDTLAETGIFPLMMTQMVKIGEESGALDDTLEKTSDFFDNEVETATAQMTTMIEPIIIVFLGVVVAFIILSIILPMFQVYETIGG
jgi:type IV pilus assembly protein PilC